MARLNLKLASLLDASGELGEPARQKLAIRIIDDPEACRQHDAAREDLSLLQVFPIPEPSAAERRMIPSMIKKAIRLALLEKEAAASAITTQRSFWRQRFTSRNLAGTLALAASVAVVVTLALVNHVQDARQTAQVARINAVINRVTVAPESLQFTLDQRATDLTAAPSAANSETPTLTFLGDGNLGLLPRQLSDSESQGESPDPSSPPG